MEVSSCWKSVTRSLIRDDPVNAAYLVNFWNDFKIVISAISPSIGS